MAIQTQAGVARYKRGHKPAAKPYERSQRSSRPIDSTPGFLGALKSLVTTPLRWMNTSANSEGSVAYTQPLQSAQLSMQEGSDSPPNTPLLRTNGTTSRPPIPTHLEGNGVGGKSLSRKQLHIQSQFGKGKAAVLELSEKEPESSANGRDAPRKRDYRYSSEAKPTTRLGGMSLPKEEQTDHETKRLRTLDREYAVTGNEEYDVSATLSPFAHNRRLVVTPRGLRPNHPRRFHTVHRTMALHGARRNEFLHASKLSVSRVGMNQSPFNAARILEALDSLPGIPVAPRRPLQSGMPRLQDEGPHQMEFADEELSPSYLDSDAARRHPTEEDQAASSPPMRARSRQNSTTHAEFRARNRKFSNHSVTLPYSRSQRSSTLTRDRGLQGVATVADRLNGQRRRSSVKQQDLPADDRVKLSDTFRNQRSGGSSGKLRAFTTRKHAPAPSSVRWKFSANIDDLSDEEEEMEQLKNIPPAPIIPPTALSTMESVSASEIGDKSLPVSNVAISAPTLVPATVQSTQTTEPSLPVTMTSTLADASAVTAQPALSIVRASSKGLSTDFSAMNRPASTTSVVSTASLFTISQGTKSTTASTASGFTLPASSATASSFGILTSTPAFGSSTSVEETKPTLTVPLFSAPSQFNTKDTATPAGFGTASQTPALAFGGISKAQNEPPKPLSFGITTSSVGSTTTSTSSTMQGTTEVTSSEADTKPVAALGFPFQSASEDTAKPVFGRGTPGDSAKPFGEDKSKASPLTSLAASETQPAPTFAGFQSAFGASKPAFGFSSVASAATFNSTLSVSTVSASIQPTSTESVFGSSTASTGEETTKPIGFGFTAGAFGSGNNSAGFGLKPVTMTTPTDQDKLEITSTASWAPTLSVKPSESSTDNTMAPASSTSEVSQISAPAVVSTAFTSAPSTSITTPESFTGFALPPKTDEVKSVFGSTTATSSSGPSSVFAFGAVSKPFSSDAIPVISTSATMTTTGETTTTATATPVISFGSSKAEGTKPTTSGFFSITTKPTASTSSAPTASPFAPSTGPASTTMSSFGNGNTLNHPPVFGQSATTKPSAFGFSSGGTQKETSSSTTTATTTGTTFPFGSVATPSTSMVTPAFGGFGTKPIESTTTTPKSSKDDVMSTDMMGTSPAAAPMFGMPNQVSGATTAFSLNASNNSNGNASPFGGNAGNMFNFGNKPAPSGFAFGANQTKSDGISTTTSFGGFQSNAVGNSGLNTSGNGAPPTTFTFGAAPTTNINNPAPSSAPGFGQPAAGSAFPFGAANAGTASASPAPSFNFGAASGMGNQTGLSTPSFGQTNTPSLSSGIQFNMGAAGNVVNNTAIQGRRIAKPRRRGQR
ncbi:hypothetical protein IWQ61_009490 [Dispira simplex]|nr:hypothetical protein IWQ61_009490 [Dispira simplex]